MSETFAIIGGEIIDSRSRRRADLILRNGIIESVGTGLTIPENAHLVDATDMIVSPGLVDIQVHLREPGQEQSEDIKSGSRAAAVGGMTAVQCMPNTNPCIDTPEAFLDVKRRASQALCDVFVSAAITKNRQSEELAPLLALYEVGARTFTDDGDCVKTARLMREAIEILSNLGNCVLAQHCEDHSLVHDGVMDEGEVSEELGLKGRHRVAEEIIISRDLSLMDAFGHDLKYHVLHLSTKEGLEVIRRAQLAGVNVTTEVAPQHFALTSDFLKSGNANFKMNPPLREDKDNIAMRQGLSDGSIPAIATDHAPHPKESKEKGIEEAPPGMLGVETALAASITHLVETGIVSLEKLIRLLSINPSRIIQAHKLENGGHGLDLIEGNPANITVFNPKEQWIVAADELHSKSENSPWDTHTLTGKVHYTFLRGEMTCEKGQPTK